MKNVSLRPEYDPRWSPDNDRKSIASRNPAFNTRPVLIVSSGTMTSTQKTFQLINCLNSIPAVTPHGKTMSAMVDKDPRLPEITTEGADSFGCLVDGKIFKPNPAPGQRNAVYGELQYYKGKTGINLYADNFADNRAILIFLYDVAALEPGKSYDLKDPSFFVQFIDFSRPPACTYLAEITGSITITHCNISGSNKIISGIFSFVASNSSCDAEVVVSEGRFDIGTILE